MTDATLDFRYILNGDEVEAYQITEESRYAQKLWPDWLDSRQFITQDGQHFFGEAEMPIPQYGWLILRGGGIDVVTWQVMEQAEKVVPIVAEVLEEVDERGISLSAVDQAPAVDDKLLNEVTMAYEMLQLGETSAAEKILRTSLSNRTTWCNCQPGNCKNVGDKIGCREHSPLVKADEAPPVIQRPEEIRSDG